MLKKKAGNLMIPAFLLTNSIIKRLATSILIILHSYDTQFSGKSHKKLLFIIINKT